MPRDPYRNFRFEVEIDGFTHAGFNKVTGLKGSTQVIDYREGGENDTMRKLPGQTSFDPVTLERGVSNNSDFINWREQIYDVDSEEGQGTVEDFRKVVVIYLKDKSGQRVKKWTITNAWPSEDSMGDLDASGNEVLIESMTLQNEGIKVENLA